MKVLQVISDRNIGGAGVLLTTLLRHFDPSRVECAVALPRGSALCERIRALDIPVYELTYPCDRVSARSIGELKGVIRLIKADLVHANAALSARIAARACHVGVLHTRHCCFPPMGIWRFGAVRALGGLYNRMLSDVVIATAEAAEEDLCRFGIPKEKTVRIINGCEEVRAVTGAERNAFLTRYGIGQDDFTVGICARLVPCKGHETFLRAAKLACEAEPQIPFRFLIAGEGPSRAYLEYLARELGIGDRVCFLGFLSDTAPFYRTLRVNVNCSTGTETSCLALSEGMSAGLPMIASDYGGNRTMIGDGSAGILCRAGDAQAFAKAICLLAKDRALEEDMKRAARLRYEREYTAERMTERVTEVYEQLLSGRRSGE